MHSSKFLNEAYDWSGIFSAMIPAKQRFENLEIWKISIEIAKEFCCIADKLKKLHLDKFSDYLREICMRISNNIAEISSTGSDKDIIRFLMNAHLSTLESENFITILYEQKLVDSEIKDTLLQKLDGLDNKILNFQKTLNENFIVARSKT